jgi:hypothetical protein
MPSSAECKTLTMFELRACVSHCGPSDCSPVGRAGRFSICCLGANSNNLARFPAAGSPKFPGAWFNATPKDDLVPVPSARGPGPARSHFFNRAARSKPPLCSPTPSCQANRLILGTIGPSWNSAVAVHLGIQLSRIGDPADAAVLLRQALARALLAFDLYVWDAREASGGHRDAA